MRHTVKAIVNFSIQILSIIISFVVFLGTCSSAHLVNDSYSVTDNSEDKIEENTPVAAKDFDVVTHDIVSSPDMAIIEGKMKVGKVKKNE